MTMTEHRYVVPTGADRVFNRMVAALTRMGISVMGSRELAVPGRSSGVWRTTPVNLLRIDGTDYLVAPRGRTQWVRNLQASGHGRLRVGRRVTPFTAIEIADADKPPVISEYLRRWGWEVGKFFENLDAKSSPADILAAAPGFPVFRVDPATA